MPRKKSPKLNTLADVQQVGLELPRSKNEYKEFMFGKEYREFLLDKTSRTEDNISSQQGILSSDETELTRPRRKSLSLQELPSQLSTNQLSRTGVNIEQRSTELSLWLRDLIQKGFLQPAEINKQITVNKNYELTIRRLVIFGLMHDSATQNVEFVEILKSINFSAISLAIIFSSINLSKKAREIAFDKLLQTDDLEFKTLDTVFDFTHNLSKLESTVKQKLKAARAEKLAKADKETRYSSLLLYAMDKYKDNRELLLLVREHYLRRFADKGKGFIRHEVDAEGNTFLHHMLNRDDPNCEQLNALIELLFSGDSSLAKEHSKHFATALIAKNKSGVSPINLILQKGLDWHESYEILTKRLIVVMVDLMLLNDAEWDNIFSEYNDCFSNTGNRNLVTTLFDAKQFLLLDTIISMRLFFRQEFELWFMQELNARIDLDNRYLKLDPKAYARRCAAIIGVNEYADIYHADEDGQPTRLLHIVVEHAENVVFSVTDKHKDFKDVPDQRLSELGLDECDLQVLDIFNFSRSFSDAARRIPAHEHRIFRKLLGEYTTENPTAAKIEVFWNSFVIHQNKHLFEVSTDHGGVCALSEAILYGCTDLVHKLCETFDVDIHPKYLLVAAVNKTNLQSGMFKYLLDQYLKKQAETNSSMYLPIDKVRDQKGIGLLYRTLILCNDLEISRQLIKLGCNVIEFYDSNESLLSQIFYNAYADKITIEEAIRQIKFLTSECGNVQKLMTKKCANGHEPLPLFLKLLVLMKKISTTDTIAVIDMLISAGAPLEYKLVGNETLLHICTPMDITIFAHILTIMSKNLNPVAFKQTLEQQNTSGFSVLDLLTVQLKFDTSAKADIQKRIDQIRSYGAEPSRGMVVARLRPSSQ